VNGEGPRREEYDVVSNSHISLFSGVLKWLFYDPLARLSVHLRNKIGWTPSITEGDIQAMRQDNLEGCAGAGEWSVRREHPDV